MLDIDDLKVGNVKEQNRFYYPEDNSIMRVDSFEIGGVIHQKSMI